MEKDRKDGNKNTGRAKRVKAKKMVLLAGCAVLAAALTSGCGSKKEMEEVHIGYFNNVTHAQALYMKAEGMLDEVFGEGVEVKWTAFNAGPSRSRGSVCGRHRYRVYRSCPGNHGECKVRWRCADTFRCDDGRSRACHFA